MDTRPAWIQDTERAYADHDNERFDNEREIERAHREITRLNIILLASVAVIAILCGITIWTGISKMPM